VRKLGGGACCSSLAIVFALPWRSGRFLYRSKVLPQWKARVPVIVVGNVSVGGHGEKRRSCLAIVELLQAARSVNPGVGRSRLWGACRAARADPLGVVAVYPDVATPKHFGDEPVAHRAARDAWPVFIGPDRPAAARALLEAQSRGRHPRERRRAAALRARPRRLDRGGRLRARFGNGLALPAGPLREPVSAPARGRRGRRERRHDDSIPAKQRFAMRYGR